MFECQLSNYKQGIKSSCLHVMKAKNNLAHLTTLRTFFSLDHLSDMSIAAIINILVQHSGHHGTAGDRVIYIVSINSKDKESGNSFVKFWQENFHWQLKIYSMFSSLLFFSLDHEAFELIYINSMIDIWIFDEKDNITTFRYQPISTQRHYFYAILVFKTF